MREWIGRIDFDPAVGAKIRIKHNLTEHEVREAILFGHAERAEFKEDTPYGPRLTAIGTTSTGLRIKALLAPVDRQDGTWECRTAYRV